MTLSVPRVSLWKSFSRAQVASVSATLVDFGALVLLVEGVGFWYVYATALGAFLGALTNFTLNRNWSFQAQSQGLNAQAIKYALVSAGSLALNSAGVYAFTEGLGFTYVVSKLFVSFLVGILFNFPLHRYFVFTVPASAQKTAPDSGRFAL